MSWVRGFLDRVSPSDKQTATSRKSPRRARSFSSRRLRYESLEQRRLLSVTLPSGKGDWIFYMSGAESNLGESTAQKLFNYEASQGVKWVVVKAQDSSTTGLWGYNSSVVAAAHTAGLKIYAFAYVRGNDSSYGSTEASELSTTLSVLSSTTPDGFVIDAETEYQGQPTAATNYCEGIKNAYPNLFLAYAPFPIISDHESYPYLQFGQYCDAVMPQAYFETGSGYNPTTMVQELDSQWTYWQNIWENGGYANSVKPIIPICQAFNDSYFTDNGSDLLDFVNDLTADTSPATAGGYQSMSFFDADSETSSMRSEIASAAIGPVLTASVTSLTLPATIEGTAGATTNFTISGTALGSGDTVTLTAPTGCQISTSSSSGFAATLKLTPSSGTLASTKIYARISASATASVSGKVTVSDTHYSSVNFTIAATGNVTPVATWSGGGTSTNWSIAGNWGGTALAAGDYLAFGGTMGLTSTNNLAAGTLFDNVTFNTGAGAFTLNGNSLGLGGNIINDTSSLQTINLPLVLVGGTRTVNTANGNVTIAGNISQNGGNYGLTKTGSNALTLSGQNSYLGGTLISAGTLILTTSTAFPQGTALTVGAGGTLDFDG